MGVRGWAVAAVVWAAMSGGSAGLRGAAAQPDSLAVTVSTAADLQTALDQVQPGQTIRLEAGRVFQGPFVLRRLEGTDWVTIRTSTPDTRFVPEGRRVKPADARLMPKLIAASGSVLIAAKGAHHYRLIGLEITPAPGVALNPLVDLGTGSQTASDLPHDIRIERSYLHGDALAGSRRGVALNSAETTIADSHFSDFKDSSADSQAVCGWAGPGPFHIINNYLEGSGENVMFGGGDPAIPNLVPSDIEIRRNVFQKPTVWRDGAGTSRKHWLVKNLLELKNARRVVIDGNLLEYSWADAQVGFAVLFTPRNQEGTAPWSVVEEVTFSNNVVRHAGGGVAILGWDDLQQSRQANRIRIVNNLFVDIGAGWGRGRLFEMLNGTADVTITNNTGVQTDVPLFGGDTLPHTGFRFENNIVLHNEYGIIGSGFGTGRPSIAQFFPGGSIRRNVLVGGNAGLYPSDNFFPGNLSDIGFADLAGLNLRLKEGSSYRGRGTDGRDVGADLDAIARAMGNVAVPRPRAASAGALVGFWGGAALIVYTYVGYAALIWLIARFAPKPARAAPYEPMISLVVVAYNEAPRISARIQNLKALDYPPDRREIIVVSDGSTDDTAALARLEGPDVRVIEHKERRGKASAYEDLLPRLRSEIVVLADARQTWSPDAARALVSHFADPSVGAVSGELVLASNVSADAGAQGAEVYWNFEKRLRWLESQVDSTIGVTGAITALRQRLFEPIPTDTVLDDVTIPLRISRRGYRVTFEPSARAFDRLSSASRDEFRRKVRTLAGNFQLFAREGWLLLPWRNRLWLQTLSHKGLRLLLPLFFLMVFAANTRLLHHPFYQVAMVAQVGFYGAAVLGGIWPTLRRKARVMVVPYAICFLACATIVGFIRFVRGRQPATWDRTAVPAAS